MLLDLTKASFHTHNGKAEFSPPLDFYINELTIHVHIITWSDFPGACLLALSNIFKCLGDLLIAVV